jgi:hypothetical protein
MHVLYNTVTINRKTGEAVYSDPVELTDDEFERAAQPLLNYVAKRIIADKKASEVQA